MEISFDFNKQSDYQKYLDCKRLPKYDVVGNKIITDKESYNSIFSKVERSDLKVSESVAFDYQEYFANKALWMKKFGIFMDCGLGKTLTSLIWARELCNNFGKVLIICPLSVVEEFYNDAKKFNIDVSISNLRKGENWNEGIGIINHEGRTDVNMKGVVGVVLDEASILKNAQGKTKKWIIDLTKGIEYKLSMSATPSPNDRTEYASQSVFLEYDSSEKSFYSRFFRRDGVNWVLKDHAQKAFYEYLSNWCCYVYDPQKMGFQKGGFLASDPVYELMDCGAGDKQIGTLFHVDTSLKSMNWIENYRCRTDTKRFKNVIENINSNNSQKIVWCSRDIEEQNILNNTSNSKLITGKTRPEERVEIIKAFRLGEIETIISKPKILGWGVNLQQAEEHHYSGYNFSFEKFYQAIRRSHRYGRDGRLKCFVPAISEELPIWDKLNGKIKTFETDVIKLQNNFKK